MTERNDEPRPGGAALVAPDRRSPRNYRIAARIITMEIAEAFAVELCSDLSHTVESAATAVGVRAGAVRQALHRYLHDECATLVDEEICEVLHRAKTEHIKQIRAGGYVSAGRGNRAGTAWMQWQLEVQAPLEHPRKQEVEVTGKDGGPIQTENAIRYVVSVPAEEPDE